MPPIDKNVHIVEADEKELIARLHATIREAMGKKPVNETAKKIKEYCKEMYKHGWRKIVVSYSGSGDSCDDFSATVWNEEGKYSLNEIDTPPREFTQELQDAIWDLLPPGFENNEGGSGEIKINVKTGKITVEHDQYYVESHHSSETY